MKHAIRLLAQFACLFALIAGLVQPSMAQSAKQVTYYHVNTQGTPVAATDQSGAIKWQQQYTNFGYHEKNEGQLSDLNETSFGLTGHVEDQYDDLLLVYMQARYYDPLLGRFLSIDPVGFSETNPQTFNRYAYANNNPHRYIDPDGRQARDANWEAAGMDPPGNPRAEKAAEIASTASAGVDIVDAIIVDTVTDPLTYVGAGPIGRSVSLMRYAASVKWKGFSKGQLSIHYEKHVLRQKEFGNISQAEYLNLAKGFSKESGKFNEANVGNFIIKHDPASGRILVGHAKSREIRTFYIDDGRSPDAFQAAIDYAKGL